MQIRPIGRRAQCIATTATRAAYRDHERGSTMTQAAKSGPQHVQAHGREPSRGMFDFFKYHGIWAPGVRLFRRVGFAAKSATITLAFAIPLGALGWAYFQQNHTNIQFSALERVGVTYLQALQPELKAAQEARSLAMRGERAPAAPATGPLATAQQSLGPTLGTEAQWKAVQGARAEVARLASDAPADLRFSVHSAHVLALLELLSQVADGSNLTLDPDVDTFYMMDSTTTKTPALIEQLAQLADTGAGMVAAGKASPLEATRADRLNSLSESSLAQLERSLGKVFDARKDLVQPLRIDTAAAQTKQFLSGAAQAFGAEVKASDATQSIAVAARAIEALRAAQKAQLDALDASLAVRIGGFERARNVMIAVVVGTLMLAGYLFYSFYLVTRGGLRELAWHIEAMANGDLTRSVRPWGRDEAAGLMESLAAMQISLQTVVSKVRLSADSVVRASTEISSASLDLSGRTEQTAAALEQSAASMEEITSTVRLTADNARQGADIAADNAAVARRGGAVIDDVVKTMDEIQQASAKIANIISVIDGIAFQTNILALNAAVEAARAGEQGRGFAVVAGEVRSLSHRSAEAAREIKSLIEATVSKVATGTKVVRSAGETMQEIVGNAERLNTLTTAIADAANQQDSGVGQIGDALQDLDRGAQQNAALVEQTAAAAGSLKDQAVELAETVSVFRLPQGTAKF
jgi:methyl-accepting chemotaxis protein